MRNALLLSASLLALPLLSACAVMEGADTEMAEISMPAAYEYLQQNTGAAPNPDWWASFNTPELNGLETQAMAANNDLLAGVERVLQARAGVGTSRAGLLPQITGQINDTFTENNGGQRIDLNTGLPIGGGAGAGGDYLQNTTGRINASYELDLFGANRADLRSSRAALASSIYSQRALELSIQADVANFYFNVLSLRERLDTARQNLASVERVMDLVQRQYDAGAVSGFDLSRQRSAVATARARIPALEEQLAQAESGLALLTGAFPQGFDAPGGDIRAMLPPPVSAGLPSDLLWRRPDLLAAEATLAGADADIDAARAAFFPTINLTAGLSISNLFDTAIGTAAANETTQSFGASLAQTLFGGGRLTAQFERNRARYRELALNYRQSVLTALKDVDDALAALRASEQSEELQQIASDEAQRAFDLSEARYEAGADDLLAVLDAQRTLLDASDSLVQARQARLNAAVGLFAALGGGWAPDEATARMAGDARVPLIP